MEDLIYIMTEAEQELAQLIWEHEPLRSGELVRLAAEHLNWKKSTTYTVLRKICENGIFQNEQSVVTSRMSQEEYARRKGERYLEENYEGSLLRLSVHHPRHLLRRQDPASSEHNLL